MINYENGDLLDHARGLCGAAEQLTAFLVLLLSNVNGAGEAREYLDKARWCAHYALTHLNAEIFRLEGLAEKR
jgi:hypothetical protein